MDCKLYEQSDLCLYCLSILYVQNLRNFYDTFTDICPVGSEDVGGVGCRQCERGYYRDHSDVDSKFGPCVRCPVVGDVQMTTSGTGSSSIDQCEIRKFFTRIKSWLRSSFCR